MEALQNNQKFSLSLSLKNLLKLGQRCSICSKKFHLFRIKHNCKKCFRLVCRTCSKDRFSKRVCIVCKGVILNLKAKSSGGQVPGSLCQSKISFDLNSQQEDPQQLNLQSNQEGNFGLDEETAHKLGFNQEQVQNVEEFSEYHQLPAFLQNLIEMNGISKQEAVANPAAAFGSLLFAMKTPPSQQVIQEITEYISAIINSNPLEKYETAQIIGKGSQGIVYVAIKRSDQSLYALKKMTPTSKQNQIDMINEIQIMSSCRHENIVNCYETFYFENSY